MSFTPGPWRAELAQLNPASERTGYTIITDAFDVVSGHLAIRRKGDATLIAAAPEMLEELEECFTVLEYVQDGHPEADKFVKERIDALYALISSTMEARG